MEQPTHRDAALKPQASRRRSRSLAEMAPTATRPAGTLSSRKRSAPTLALSVEQACDALGVSWDTWNEHIAPDMRIVRIGRRKLIAVSELQRWLEDHGECVR
jgi:excisionase family DNA binding protein